MKKLKKLMYGYKRRIFGKYIVSKEICHSFDDEYNEHFGYIYIIEKM